MDQQQYTTLVEVLKQVPDPRKRQGQCHRWITLLTLIAAALASAQPALRYSSAFRFALAQRFHHPACLGTTRCGCLGERLECLPSAYHITWGYFTRSSGATSTTPRAGDRW
jgi:hypothetical protein